MEAPKSPRNRHIITPVSVRRRARSSVDRERPAFGEAGGSCISWTLPKTNEIRALIASADEEVESEPKTPLPDEVANDLCMRMEEFHVS